MTFSQIEEWLGVISALLYVYLATKGLRSCFIFGLISSIIFIRICFVEKLYFDTAINTYYVAMSFVGWFSWKSDNGEFRAIKMPWRKFIFFMMTSVILVFVLGFITQKYTEASLPYIDSFTTVMAVLATWMMVKKIIQNWLIWILADGFSIGMYIYKEHYPIALLFLVYTMISVYGLLNWKNNLEHD